MIKRILTSGVLLVASLSLFGCFGPDPAPKVTVKSGGSGEVGATLSATPALDSSEEWFQLQGITFTDGSGREVLVVFDYNSARYSQIKRHKGSIADGLSRGLADQAKENLPGRNLFGKGADLIQGDNKCTILKATLDHVVVERCAGGDRYVLTLTNKAEVITVRFTDNSGSEFPNTVSVSQKTSRGDVDSFTFEMRR
ncbi:MAG: hypothetical protein OSB62_02300 [Alphaproteobacteria bacterium]|nr:hypothetical protein [Alphaproteobacteria bacterium]